MPKRSLLLLLAAMLACPLPAYADTVTIGYFDPASDMPGIQILSSVSGPVTANSPINQILDHPLLLGSGFGFDQIIAMVIPPTGNVYSGGTRAHRRCGPARPDLCWSIDHLRPIW